MTCLNTKENSNDILLLDSGCRNHMIGLKGLIRNIDESVKLQVQLGDGKHVQAEGKGVIAVRTKSGIEKQVHDVLYSWLSSQSLNYWTISSKGLFN